MRRDPARLSKTLGYAFADDQLLEAALTHRSAAASNNERLEYLGDAVLGLVIAEAVFQRRAEASEGELSRLRASLVRGRTLAQIGADLVLGDYLHLGPGELKSGGYRRGSILADALEAVIGAIYLDGGFDPARRCILRLYEDRLANLPQVADLKDAKTRLQELLQGRGVGLPVYSVSEVTGEAHAQRFTVLCDVAQLQVRVTGEGSSRRRAEQDAAERALARISSG